MLEGTLDARFCNSSAPCKWHLGGSKQWNIFMHSRVHMGCELAHLNDIFWNRESISGSDESFSYENATAIAYALRELNVSAK